MSSTVPLDTHLLKLTKRIPFSFQNFSPNLVYSFHFLIGTASKDDDGWGSSGSGSGKSGKSGSGSGSGKSGKSGGGSGSGSKDEGSWTGSDDGKWEASGSGSGKSGKSGSGSGKSGKSGGGSGSGKSGKSTFVLFYQLNSFVRYEVSTS